MDKASLRRDLRANRRGRSATIGLELAALLAHFGLRPTAVLAAYLPLAGEPDLRPALAAWPGPILMPRVEAEQRLAWVRWWTGAEVVPGAFGVDTPVGPASALVPDALLIPALAVSRAGTRLGQGAGYYDRELATRRRYPAGPLRVAVVYDDEVRTDLPREPHDESVDAVLTPTRWLLTRS